MQDEPVVLYNCMGRDIYVVVDGEEMILPALPTPRVLDDHAGAAALRVRIGERQTLLRLQSGEALGTMFLPDPVEGVRYLVPVALLLRLPHRSDLVTPARYRFSPRSPADASDEPWTIRCLAAVAPTLGPVHPQAPNISAEDVDDDFDDDEA